jgi:hypothetical protein
MADVARPTEYHWRDFDIPAGTVPVSLVRLALDRDSLVSQSLVRFPQSWARRESGWYSVDEEFLILEGALHMSGNTYLPGDYALVPAGYLRFASTTPDGCLLLAWFSGRAIWNEAARHGSDYDPNRLVQATWSSLAEGFGPAGPGRRLRQEGHLSSWILTGDLPSEVPAAIDLFSISDHSWAQAESGDPLPAMATPVFARLRAT